MTSTWDTTLKKRVERAARFDDNTFYINYLRYFDVLGQLHSVAETKYGTWMLRLWRATQFGPEKYERCREEGMFRVRQDYFHRYIIPPDPHIAKAINVYGYNHLMEIEIYDEHRDYLEALRSGEYITVTNVHYSKGKVGDSLKLHGGSLYNRGIFKVPDDCSDHRFLEVKRRIENALDQITDYQDFVEFTEVSYPNAMPIQTPSASSSSKSSSSANFFSPPTFPTKRKWKSFRAATENGKTAIAKPCQKIIIGDLIAVDWFGKRDARKYHFLTHGHTDHCRNLDRRWAQKVYCSPKTALILPQIMGYENERCVPPGIIHPLEEDIPHQFEEFTVTLISANHCPGSVMFVFEGPAVPGERVLCTGDFRADKNLMKQLEPEEPLHWLTEKKFDTIYIDNTYFSLHLPFPDRVTAFNELTRGISQHPDKNIYIPLQRLGREEMIEDLSRAIMEPIFAYTEKKSFSCAMSYFFEFGIRNPTRTIRIVKRNKWQLAEEEDHMDFVIFDVSMLHHLTVSDSMIERHKDRVYRIPYSDHSSRDEILEFLKQFCFSSVVPTSKPITEKDLKIMIECTRESSATFAHSEGKLVIENEDETGVEMEMANQENGRKNDDVDKIVEKTKSMGVQRQMGPLDSTPLPPNRDDLDYTIREQHVLGSTLEAMLESAAPPGILTDDDGTPGPSGVDLHPLNLELEMDLSEMGIGLDLPTTPSPLLASSQYPRHSRPRHLHQHLQLNNHLSSEIDDAIVQRAEEQYRNLHMRLNSPEEQQLETLHLSQERHSSSKNRWNQKTPEKQFQNGVFSPLYTQEMVEVEKNQSALDPVIEQPDGSETPSPSIALPNSILEQDGEKMEEDVVPEPEPESQNPNENEPTSSVQNPEEAMEKELSVSNENALKEAEKVPVAEEEVCEKSEDVFKGQEDTPVEEDVPEEVPIQENAPEEAEAVPIEVDHAPEEAENVSNIESEAVPMEEDVNFEEGEEEEDNPMDEAILEPEDVTPEEPEAAEKELDQEHEKTPELEEEPQQEEQRPEEEEVADSEPEPADDFTRMEQPEEEEQEEVENLENLRVEKKPIVKNVKEVENDDDRSEDDEDEDEDDYDFDPNLDNWSEGPPRTLKEAIARLQYRSSSSQRRRQHAL